MPYIGKSPSAGVRQRYQYTATAGQTTFSGTDLGNLTLTYTDNNFVDVFQNGVLLKGGGTDYTATSGTSVVLTTGASVSDVIEIIVYDVFSVGNFYSRTDSDSRYLNVAGDTMTGSLDLNGTELVLDADGDTSITADTDDRIDIKIAGSDVAAFDASGNLSLGNGTATNDGIIHINGGSSAKNIVIESDRDTDGQGLGNIQFHESGTNVVQISAERGTNDTSGDLVLYAAISGSLGERLRISHINTTITNPVGSNNTLILHNTAGSSPYGLQIDNDVDMNNGSNWFINAIGDTTARFRVYTNGNVVNTNNSYGSISDEKLKENIVDSGSQWDDIKALKVRKYSLKEDKLDAPNKLGVIAQELETAGMNGLVLDTPDVDKDLKDLGTVTKTVNYSILYMKAVKALQEAMTRIETLEAEVAKLKG